MRVRVCVYIINHVDKLQKNWHIYSLTSIKVAGMLVKGCANLDVYILPLQVPNVIVHI